MAVSAAAPFSSTAVCARGEGKAEGCGACERVANVEGPLRAAAAGADGRRCGLLAAAGQLDPVAVLRSNALLWRAGRTLPAAGHGWLCPQQRQADRRLVAAAVASPRCMPPRPLDCSSVACHEPVWHLGLQPGAATAGHAWSPGPRSAPAQPEHTSRRKHAHPRRKRSLPLAAGCTCSTPLCSLACGCAHAGLG